MESLGSYMNIWTWLIIGLVLAAAEMAAPGAFLIWLAGAAVVTGLLAGLLGLSWPLQLALFAVLAFVSVLAGRAWMKRHPIQTSDTGLNDRASRLIGEIVTVSDAIRDGHGKVTVGDSPWLASGPDAPVGSRMRIVAVDGTTLKVEPA